MVIIRLFFIFLCQTLLSHSTLYSAWGESPIPPYVEIAVAVNPYQTYENEPVQTTISITHDASLKIDASTFTMENKPLKVESVKTVKLSSSSPLELSIYNFVIPGKPKGLYYIPEISVMLNGIKYSSYPISYEVSGRNGMEPMSNRVNNSKVNEILTKTDDVKPELNLKASVEGKENIYSGQRLKFVYRFYFIGDIELTAESLPLIEAANFRKIGSPQIKNYKEGLWNVEEIVQEVEAASAGKFTFPASFIEGYGYKEDRLKQRTYLKSKMHAEAPEITVTVLPFPEKGKPSTFTGAIGKFTMDVSLLTPATVQVEDQIQLLIAISGNENLGSVILPDIGSQSAFKKMFRLSDLPPIGKLVDKKKQFTLELRPLSTLVKEIPKIEFSFFNPDTGKFVTLQSQPIPIVVSPRGMIEKNNEIKKVPESKETLPENIQDKILEQEHDLAKITPQTPIPIEIEGNYSLEISDLKNIWLGTWLGLLWIPFAILAIISQFFLQASIIKIKNQVPIITSEEIFNEFLAEDTNSPQFYHLLNQAFLKKLSEKNYINSENLNLENLPLNGIVGEVREFLYRIEEQRFSGKMTMTHEKIVDNAKTLFAKIAKKEV